MNSTNSSSNSSSWENNRLRLVSIITILTILLLIIIILFISIHRKSPQKKLRRQKCTNRKYFKSTTDTLHDQSMVLLKKNTDPMINNPDRIFNDSYNQENITNTPTDSILSISSQFNSITHPLTETNDNLTNLDLTNIPIRRLNQPTRIDPTLLQLSDRPSYDVCDNQYVVALKKHNKARIRARKQYISTPISIDSKP